MHKGVGPLALVSLDAQTDREPEQNMRCLPHWDNDQARDVIAEDEQYRAL